MNHYTIVAVDGSAADYGFVGTKREILAWWNTIPSPGDLVAEVRDEFGRTVAIKPRGLVALPRHAWGMKEGSHYTKQGSRADLLPTSAAK